MISCNGRSFLWMDYIWTDFFLMDTIQNINLRKQIAAEFEILNIEKKDRKKEKEGTSKPSPQKAVL